MPERSSPVMLYDGAGRFCVRVAAVSRARFPAVSWEPYQTADLGAYGVSEAEAASSVRLVEPAGRVVHGSAAFARLLVLSGAPWSVLGRVLLAPPVALVAEAVYRLVAAVRHRLPGP